MPPIPMGRGASAVRMDLGLAGSLVPPRGIRKNTRLASGLHLKNRIWAWLLSGYPQGLKDKPKVSLVIII